MKVTLDLDQLLRHGAITREEYDRLSHLAARSTGSLAFNLLIGFGVVAVSGAALALVPAVGTAVTLGLGMLALGIAFLRAGTDQWGLFAQICILVGSLLTGGGITGGADGSLASILGVAGLFAVTAVFARSGLLAVLATLMLSAAVGARTGYFHASYFLIIREPVITVVLFTLLAMGLYQLAKAIPRECGRLALVAARTAVFLVNFGFWVGSLWGDDLASLSIPDSVFSVAWALALLATGIWSWRRNRRWVLNTCAVFAGIHLYTQWFEHLHASAGSVLLAGLVALTLALVLHRLNRRMAGSALE